MIVQEMRRKKSSVCWLMLVTLYVALSIALAQLTNNWFLGAACFSVLLFLENSCGAADKKKRSSKEKPILIDLLTSLVVSSGALGVLGFFVTLLSEPKEGSVWMLAPVPAAVYLMVGSMIYSVIPLLIASLVVGVFKKRKAMTSRISSRFDQ